jgi:hypothetical protein
MFIPQCQHHVWSKVVQKLLPIFIHTNEYFEYLFSDPSYLEEEIFIMRRLGGLNYSWDDSNT